MCYNTPIMKSFWVNGILGVWLVILAYLGLPSSTKNIIIIISGLIVAFISFRRIIQHKIIHNLKIDDSEKDKKT